MRVARIAIALTLGAVLLSAQEPQFEVASVKHSAETRPGRFVTEPSGRLLIGSRTVLELVLRAYGVERFAIDGLPAWAADNRYDIQAIAPARQEPYDSAEVGAMLRRLLADRFGLVTHTESRVRSVFLLMREHPERPLSAGFRPPSSDCGGAMPAGGARREAGCGGYASSRLTQAIVAATYYGRTLPDFAADLGGRVGRPVLDRTGINGRFDIELSNERGQDVFIPLREQLGLRLTSADAPIEMLVVDSAHPPTPD